MKMVNQIHRGRFTFAGRGHTASIGTLPLSTSFVVEGEAIFGRWEDTTGKKREREEEVAPLQDQSSDMALQISPSLHRPTAFQCRHRMTIWQPFGTSTHVPAAALPRQQRMRYRRHSFPVCMSGATDFPLPRLDRFEWQELKLADLTGKHRLSLLMAYTSRSIFISSARSVLIIRDSVAIIMNMPDVVPDQCCHSGNAHEPLDRLHRAVLIMLSICQARRCWSLEVTAA